ncbi:hypothetical protein H0251_19080 [Pectobacterium carotovorum]|uniref:hypothetical protein n=1 Tax=Pectobacterium carotovorum TaxID=554 RepID=UPI0015E0508A|nr:hypothetical protein [Pectobacterium carotovorum]MBA0181723.1 hypothetical protein [Pectobacterium carotovorum]
MNNYLLKISKFYDSNNEVRYYISDSFGTCLGSTSSVEVAFSLASEYAKEIIDIYYKNKKYDKCDMLKKMESDIEKHINEKNEIDYIEEICTSIKITKNKNKLNLSKDISTISFELSKNINCVFSQDEIKNHHSNLLYSKLIDKNIAESITPPKNKELNQLFPELVNHINEQLSKKSSPNRKTTLRP